MKTMNESVWADLHSRGIGETEREEDKINLERYEFIILGGAASRALCDAYSPDDNSKEGLIKYIEDRKKEHRYTYHSKKLEDYTYDRMIKYVDLHWGDCKNIKQFIDECIPDIDSLTESVWGDLHKRGVGELEREEDEIPESIKEALAAYIDIFVHGIDGADVYTVGSLPDFKAFIKDFANKPRISNIDFDMDELLDYVEDHWDYILDIILKTMEAYDKQIDDIYDQIRSDLEKGEVSESVWGDLHSRGIGELNKEEDDPYKDWDLENITKEEFYDYLTTYYEPIESEIYEHNSMIRIPIYAKNGFNFLTVNYNSRKELWYVCVTCTSSLKQILMSEYVLRPISEYRKVYEVSPKDGKLTHKFCIELLDYILKNVDRPLLKKIYGVNECDGVPGGLTPASVGGMGAAYFPGPDGSPGSGDLPSPTGKVYHQVAPYTMFVQELKKKKKKRKKFRKEDEPCAVKDNPPIYKHVDDFREYVDRIYNQIDKRK